MKIRFIKPVYAHCDAPCGIYETNTMMYAAATCSRMIEKVNELGQIDSIEKQANLSRYIAIKEASAQKVKNEMYLLWSDYFKPEHLEKHPDLHDIIWQATKQASKVKQTVSAAECQTLSDQVRDIARIFAESKK